MLNNRFFIWLCVFLLVPSLAFAAAGARIIADATAPGCFGFEESQKNCHSLEVTANSGESVTYTVDDVLPNTVYTVSFMYKLDSGSFSFSTVGADAVSGTLTDRTWKRFYTTFTTTEPVPADFRLRFTAHSASTVLFLDELQMTPSPEPTKFNTFDYEIGCCQFDFCWTGGVIPEHPSCIHSKFYEKNVSMPPIGWNLADFGGNTAERSTFLNAPNGYRCINGSWKFSRAKVTPLYDGAGYCNDDSQCYNGDGSGNPLLACTDDGVFIPYSGVNNDQPAEYFYCYNGNWTTRTKEIALQLYRMANRSADNRYTIFCDRFDRSLNTDETFSFYRDYVGDNIVTILTSGLVEEFCVMELNGQVIAGVALTNEINQTAGGGEDCYLGGFQCLTEGNCDDAGCLLIVPPDFVVTQKSFIEMLKGSEPEGKDYCNSAIGNLDGNYNICSNNDVYYNAKLKSVIFTKTTQSIQAVPFETTTTLIGEIWAYLKQVLSDLLDIAGLPQPATELVTAQQLDFIQKAGSFDKLYISYDPDGPNGQPRTIRAIRETRAHKRYDVGVDYRTFISAEYTNYQSDICSFFYRHNYNDVRNQISSKNADNIQCTPVILNESTNEWMHSIYVDEPVFELTDLELGLDLAAVRIWKGASDTFWNDITAKIRTQAAKDLPDEEPAPPTFISVPENPVVGAEMVFNITSPDEQSRRILARTWYFGDGDMASSAFNVTTKHMYEAAMPYQVTLCVMNSNYRITCSLPVTVDVLPGPQVSIEESQSDTQKDHGDITVDFVMENGNPTYTIRVDWGDGESDEANSEDPAEPFSYSGSTFTAVHRYSRAGSYQINVTGTDSTGDAGVEYRNQKVVVVEKRS